MLFLNQLNNVKLSADENYPVFSRHCYVITLSEYVSSILL